MKVPKCSSCGKTLKPGEQHPCRGRMVYAPVNSQSSSNDIVWSTVEAGGEIFDVVGSIAEGAGELLGAIAEGITG